MAHGLAVELRHQPEAGMEPQLADGAPVEKTAALPVQSAAQIQMVGQSRQATAQDAEPFEADAALFRRTARQKRSRFDREAGTVFLLQHSFPYNGLQGHSGIADAGAVARVLADDELAYGFDARQKAVIEHDCRNDEVVSSLLSFEVEIEKRRNNFVVPTVVLNY